MGNNFRYLKKLDRALEYYEKCKEIMINNAFGKDDNLAVL